MNEIKRAAHPRPDRVRENWQMLNGQWKFAFDRQDAGEKERWYAGHEWETAIEVPFVYQSPASGINSQEHVNVVWYEREFDIPQNLRDMRRLLHFGAVDYRADVWLDGQYLGSHEGGYTPFTFDVTNLTHGAEKARLTVRCEDRLDFDQPRGKQSFRPANFGCWYSPSTGIWQSVWLEGVGEHYVQDFRLTPDIELGAVRVELDLNEIPADGSVVLTAAFNGQLAARQELTVVTDRHVQTMLFLAHNDGIEGIYYWAPGQPNLYDLTIETRSGGKTCDAVDTYFGMRKIYTAAGKVMLNQSTLYQRLVLDQGYWPEGILTAPTDEALRRDVELTLAMGYNGARKHQKFEDPQYLYWADKLGLLVWGELPSAYWLRDSQKRNMLRDMSEAIRRDYNHPCLITWVPLNESWGVPMIQCQKEAQKLADALYATIHSLDGTRLVSGNDGWEQASTDLLNVHDYTAWPEELNHDYDTEERMVKGAPSGWRMNSAQGYDHAGKPMLMTEFGGIAMTKDATGENWGYNGAVNSEEAFLKRFEAITQAFKHMPAFQGYCYTQLTDVYQEVNGLMDMDRNMKAPIEEIRRINLQR